MPLNLYSGAPNDPGLFDLLGKVYYSLDLLLVAHGSTVPGAVAGVMSMADAVSDQLAIDQALRGLPSATFAWQGGSDSLAPAVRQAAERLTLELVRREMPGRAGDLEEAWGYVIEQMQAQGETVLETTTSLGTPSAGSGNLGPQISIAGTDRDDRGYVQPMLLAETLEMFGDSAGVRVLSGPRADALRYDWPAGSGLDTYLPMLGPDSSLVPNGDFGLSGDGVIPDYWIVHTGDSPTHVALTEPEEQTVTISGTPTGGWYALLYTDPDGRQWGTAPIAYDAGASAVQSALRAIGDLAEVTVESTGTSPNYTHTVTFHGLGGNIQQLASINKLTGGSSPAIAHATTQQGEAGSFRGRTLKIIGDAGGTKPVLYVPVTVAGETPYILHVWLRRDAATAGEVQFAVLDGIDGAVTTSPADENNALSVSVPGLSDTAHQAASGAMFFRAEDAGTLWLRIEMTTALNDGGVLYIDDLVLVPATRLYTGGPALACLRPNRTPEPGQYWTLAPANNRAGKVHEWTHRVFRLHEYGLTLPTSDSPTIPESVIGS